MKQIVSISLFALALSGCALFQKDGGPSGVTGPAEPQPATEFAPAGATAALGARAVCAVVQDTTTAEDKAPALPDALARCRPALGRKVMCSDMQ